MRITAIVATALVAAACSKEEPPKPPPPKAAPKPTTPAPQVRGDAPPVMGGVRRTDLPEPPPPPPIAVEQLSLGKLVGSDKAPLENIQASDKLYAQLETKGVGQVMVRVRWSRVAEGKLQVINEGGRVVVGNGPGSHVFEIHNAEGWKPGDYQVEVFVDDRPLATRRFGVQ